MTNGYKTIDFGGAEIPVRDYDHPTGEIVIPGIYEEFEGASKPIMISNAHITNLESFALPYSTFITVTIVSSTFQFAFTTYNDGMSCIITVVVNDDDTVYAEYSEL